MLTNQFENFKPKALCGMKKNPLINIIVACYLIGGPLFLPHDLFAQSRRGKFNDIYFEKLNFENGLSSNVVKCIFQDREGFIWFGTADGLNRYDGKTFKVFKNDANNAHSLSGNIITGIAEDKRGLLWITTLDGGLCCYNRHALSAMQFEQYRHDPKKNNSVPANNLNGLAIDRNDNVWVVSENNGAFSIDGKTKQIHYISNKEADPQTKGFTYGSQVIKVDDEGKLWCGLYGDLLMRIDPDKNTVKDYLHFKAKNGAALRAGYIRSLLSALHTVWFAHSCVLDQYNYKTGDYNQYPLTAEYAAGKQSDPWVAIERDTDGNLWIASQKNGCYIFDTATKKFYNLRYDPLDAGSLCSNTVNCVYCDRTGIMWVATAKGVCKYDVLTNQVRYHYVHDAKRPSLENLNIYDFYEHDDGSFWLATDGGLFIRNKNENDFKCKYARFHDKPLIIYKFVKYTDGKVYMVTNSSNITYDKQKDLLTQIPFFIDGPRDQGNSYEGCIKTAVVADTVYSIWYSHGPGTKYSVLISDFAGNRNNLRRDTSGAGYPVLWVGSIGWGLYLYRLSENMCGVNCVRAMPDCLSNNQIQAIIKDDSGKIWIGTNGGGVNSIEYKSLYPGFRAYKNEPSNPYSLSSNNISDMCLDENGIFWITTYDGVLNRFDPNAKDKRYFRRITGTDDVSRQAMFSILPDEKNNLWIATASAILKYSVNTNKFSAWKLKEQLPYDQFPGKKYNGKDGTIYFGGDKFYISFHPDSLGVNFNTPAVVVTSFKIFDSTADDMLLKNEIKLEHNKNFFGFEFAALNFSDPAENKFAYKLDGIDKGWIQNGNKNSAFYTGVPPGSYTFYVKGSNNDDVWNENAVSIRITILPPWWETWWFRTASALTVACLIFFVTRYYFRQKMKLQREQFERERVVETVRARISQDIHDEIGSGLTKISLMGQRLKTQIQHGKELDPTLLEKITESSKEVIGNLGEIIWTVNPKHDNLQSLLAYLRNYIANFFEHTSIQCTIDFPEEIPAVTISAHIKHNLFLVIKESLNNIIKHAEATKVDVNFELSDHTFCFGIVDNGEGIADVKGRDFGNGLINMKNRMEAINGNFEIKSEMNKGTTIMLKGNFV